MLLSLVGTKRKPPPSLSESPISQERSESPTLPVPNRSVKKKRISEDIPSAVESAVETDSTPLTGSIFC